MMVDALADGDRTKWDYFFMMPVVEFLNACTFHKDKMNKLKEEMSNGNRRI